MAGKLKPVARGEEARKRGAAGGVKSGEARRERKALRERLEILLAGKTEGMERADAITLALIEKALAGDVRAYEVIRDTLGEKPVERQQTEITGGISVSWLKEGEE